MAQKLCVLTLLLPLVLVLGCGEQGKVEQGRVIAYDKASQKVTIIRDIKAVLGKPEYDQLPPVTFELPQNPREMGAEPKAGKLMKLDIKNRQIVIFATKPQDFQKIDYTPIDQRQNVGFSDPMVEGKKFPLVDRSKKAVTIYDKRNKVLTSFFLPEEYFVLPDDTFGFGDEVRVYYKEPGKALRLMNISETDIYKK